LAGSASKTIRTHTFVYVAFNANDVHFVPAHWNNCQWVETCRFITRTHYLDSETPGLYYFSLLLMFGREATKTPILWFWVWQDRGSNPRSTALEAIMLTITPPVCFKQGWKMNTYSLASCVGGFLRVLLFPLPIKLTTKILLKYCWKWR
jgi:hypothetical protein